MGEIRLGEILGEIRLGEIGAECPGEMRPVTSKLGEIHAKMVGAWAKAWAKSILDM